MDGVKYRALETRDIARIRDMFSEAFALGTYSNNPFIMRHLLDHYLCAYIKRATYTLIAEKDGRVLGFLMGSARADKRRGSWLMEFYHALFLIVRRAGRAYFRARRRIERADRSMRQSASFADCELILFVVDRSMRGRGLGREMLRRFRHYLKLKRARTMFLFTDDYSDVCYYRTRGYREEGVRKIAFSQDEVAHFYLFSIPVKHVGGTKIDDKAESVAGQTRP